MAKKAFPVNKTVKNIENRKTKARLSPEIKSLLERADCARREFRYKEAVELYTQAIDTGELDPVNEFDVRNHRRESYYRYGGSEEAQKADIKQMMRLAR